MYIYVDTPHLDIYVRTCFHQHLCDFQLLCVCSAHEWGVAVQETYSSRKGVKYQFVKKGSVSVDIETYRFLRETRVQADHRRDRPQ